MQNNHRLRFTKTGRAKYISHLDLMRTFQRAFLRAEVEIKHTEGFNPHAFVSIPLPLSVGFSSECEILDFALMDGQDMASVPERMNRALPEGIIVQSCYTALQPVKALSFVHYIITLEYENGTPFGAETAIRDLLHRESLIMVKKSKKAKTGQVEVDIIPLIRQFTCEGRRDSITLDAIIRAQNPGLNPELMVAAIRRDCPDMAPDFTTFHRKDILNAELEAWT
ncbi:MAG: TIGR03936 family radical SAM-associated protein [Pseudoflavonifractor sp.]